MVTCRTDATRNTCSPDRCSLSVHHHQLVPPTPSVHPSLPPCFPSLSSLNIPSPFPDADTGIVKSHKDTPYLPKSIDITSFSKCHKSLQELNSLQMVLSFANPQTCSCKFQVTVMCVRVCIASTGMCEVTGAQ